MQVSWQRYSIIKSEDEHGDLKEKGLQFYQRQFEQDLTVSRNPGPRFHRVAQAQ